MSFFNKKEEVLDIQLTQLGKYLLSKGKLKPVYYAFSDDEILYSTEYVNDGKVETKKETSERIQKETQRTKGLYIVEGVETRVLRLNGYSIKNSGKEGTAKKTGKLSELPVGEMYGFDLQDDEMTVSEDRDLMRNILGHSTPGQQYSPTWEVESLSDGKITEVVVSSSTPNIGIKRPEISIEVDYQLNAEKIAATEENAVTLGEYNVQTGLEREITFVDSTVMKVDNDALVLSVVEKNVDYSKDNFEVELFRKDQVFKHTRTIFGQTLPVYRPHLERIYFSGDITNRNSHDDRYVEHYFEMTTDQDMADSYGVDVFGTQRQKLKELVKSTIELHRRGMDLTPDLDQEVTTIDNMPDPCDDEGEY